MEKENIFQMKERHAKEIMEMQDNCSHKKVSGWVDNYFAPGHRDGEVKVCQFCGKIIERKREFNPGLEIVKNNKEFVEEIKKFENKKNK